MRSLFGRSMALPVVLTVVVVLFAAGGTVWWATGRGNDSRIAPEELRAYPPIVLVAHSEVVGTETGWAHYTGAGDLYVVRADGTGLRRLRAWKPRLTDGNVYGAYDARWSPDRASIALDLAMWNSDPSSLLAVVSADGRRLRTLTDWSWNRGPLAGWSQDGQELLYQQDSRWWSIPATGGRAKRFGAGSRYIYDYDFAPDGRHIVGTVGERGVVTMTADGKNVVYVTHGVDSSPAWSPDGRAIAFVRSRDDRLHIYVVGADGQDARLVASDASAPVWSPDGSKILFLREARGRPNAKWNELYAMDADGGRQTRFAFNRPRWSVITSDWGN